MWVDVVQNISQRFRILLIALALIWSLVGSSRNSNFSKNFFLKKEVWTSELGAKTLSNQFGFPFKASAERPKLLNSMNFIEHLKFKFIDFKNL